MRLFTSNSRFVLTTLAISVFCFVAYNAFVAAVPLQYLPKSANAKSAWVAKFQKYSAAKNPTVIFAGSSLTNAIPAPYFPDDTYSLGLSGGSPITAVALANMSANKADIAIVEVNVLHRGIDKPFIDSRESIKERLAITMPALRPHNRPLSYVSESIVGAAKARANNHIRFACGGSKDRPAWLASREKAKISWEKGKKESVMLHNAKGLKREVDKLIESGTQVYLIAYPVHPLLSDTLYYKQVNEITKQTFPAPEYSWLTVKTDNLLWYDGMHLEPSSAFKFMKRVMDIVQKKNPELPTLPFGFTCDKA